MLVVSLEVTHYPPDGASWNTVTTPEPSWAVIEEAIRRLDRDEWPYLWLYTTEPVDGEMPENALCVMGGRGEYSLTLSKDGGETHYVDESRSDTAVRVWESDQGAVVVEKHLCNDLSLVLRIAQRFADSAELDSRVRWAEY